MAAAPVQWTSIVAALSIDTVPSLLLQAQGGKNSHYCWSLSTLPSLVFFKPVHTFMNSLSPQIPLWCALWFPPGPWLTPMGVWVLTCWRSFLWWLTYQVSRSLGLAPLCLEGVDVCRRPGFSIYYELKSMKRKWRKYRQDRKSWNSGHSWHLLFTSHKYLST